MNRTFSVSSILLSIVNGLGIVVALKVNNTGLLGVVWSLALANVAGLIYLSIKTRLWKYVNSSLIDGALIKTLISYSWPIVPNNLSNWVLRLSDRFVITGFLGVEANAVYAVATKIPNLLSIAQSVFILAWQESASIAVNDEDAEVYYTQMFDNAFRLMIGTTAALIGFTPLLFALLIRGDYSDAYVQIPILILAMFFYVMAAFLGGIYVAHKRTKSIGITTTVAALINLAVDLLFVNLIGITAGSISTLVAYMFLYFYRIYNLRKFQPMDFHFRTQMLCLGIVVAMFVICMMNTKFLNVVNLALGICVFFIVNRNLIQTSFRKLRLIKKNQ